jgi:pimeloyl-ACP methyl ester carboxylesterase
MPPHLTTDQGAKPHSGLRPAPYAERFLEAAGLRLHYLDYGAAGRPTMLCLHGGGAHAHWFDLVASEFRQHFHVLALDQRGHGDSEWAEPPEYSFERYAWDVDEVVSKLDLRDFVLVGHSMGGTVALTYAAAHSARLKALIVVDSTLKMTADRVTQLREIGNRQPSGYAAREDLIARYRLRPDSKTTPPEIVRYIAESSGRQSADGRWRHKFDRRVYALREPVDGLSLWSRISVPTLLIRGEHSTRITPEVYSTVKARCPQVVLAEVPASDHHIMLDNPEGFVEAAREFLLKQDCA